MSVAVIDPPAAPVTLTELKRHLRLGEPGAEAAYTDEDDLLALLLAAVSAHLDGPGGWLGRAIGLQTLELRQDGFFPDHWRLHGGWAWDGAWTDWGRWPFGRIELPYPPFIAVETITYEGLDGTDQVLTSGGWTSSDEGAEPAWGTSWPSGRTAANAVRIRYKAGYVVDPMADPLVPAPPAPIKAAVLLMAADLYANREAQIINSGRGSATENPTVQALLAPFRVWRV